MRTNFLPHFVLPGAILLAMVLPIGAWGDIFVIDGSTNPMTMQYYAPPSGSQTFGLVFSWTPEETPAPGIETGALAIVTNGFVPENPSSPQSCFYFGSFMGTCWNTEEFFLPNGTEVYNPLSGYGYGVVGPAAIYNQAGDLLWYLLGVGCGDPALCNATFVPGVAGAPIPIDELEEYYWPTRHTSYR